MGMRWRESTERRSNEGARARAGGRLQKHYRLSRSVSLSPPIEKAWQRQLISELRFEPRFALTDHLNLERSNAWRNDMSDPLTFVGIGMRLFLAELARSRQFFPVLFFTSNQLHNVVRV